MDDMYDDEPLALQVRKLKHDLEHSMEVLAGYMLAEAKAIQALNAIPGGSNGEGNHAEADDILLATVSAPVREAYEALIERTSWWAHA